MNNLSERVQREFESWKEKYEIADHMEFEIKTLLKLQEEYEGIPLGSNTTKTRESLLQMIHRLHMNIMLKEKVDVIKPMYVDCIRADAKEDSQRGKMKVIIYVDNQLIILDNKTHLNSRDYARTIYKLAKSKNSIVYIDIHGLGMVIYDELVGFKDLPVEKLHLINNCCR